MAELGLVISHLFNEASPQGLALADQSQVWSLRFVPEPAWLSEKPRRRIFHWGLGPVEADFKKAFLNQKLDRYLAEHKTELFSFDLGPSARRHQGILPASPPLSPSDIFRHSETALKVVRDYYQGPLAAENYNYYPTGLYDYICEPDFIRTYLDEFGLGLTLDLAHAAVSAYNLGLDLIRYLEALPLEKTMEIHISRPWLPEQGSPAEVASKAASRPGGLWAVDSHGPPRAEEWNLLSNIIKNSRIAPSVPVFVEYYSNLSKLKGVQEYLATMLDMCN